MTFALRYINSKRPRPVLIKLASAWDRKVVLLRRRHLKEFEIPRLFLSEDVPPQHKLRQRVITKTAVDTTSLSKSYVLHSEQPLSQSVAPTDRVTRSSSPLPVLHSSLPLTDSYFVRRSASPDIIHSSSTSSSTDSHDSATLQNAST